jgi:hypothetical protein
MCSIFLISFLVFSFSSPFHQVNMCICCLTDPFHEVKRKRDRRKEVRDFCFNLMMEQDIFEFMDLKV